MAKAELGVKRVCPETGRKFYDLNRDPIVSPYTGVSYPKSYFESEASIVEEEEEVETKELDSEDAAPELAVTDDGDDADSDKDDDLPDLGDDEDIDIGDDDDDTFLEDEEEGDGDVSGIIGVGDEDDDEV